MRMVVPRPRRYNGTAADRYGEQASRLATLTSHPRHEKGAGMVLPDAPTVARDLAHTLWIGGAPDAGKTTIGRLLAERRHWQWYSCDLHTHDHIARSDPTQLPATYAKFGKSIDERWVHPSP